MANLSPIQPLRGLALPATRGGGYFASKSAYEVAWGDLVRTMLTPRGSVPANRSFGSGLHQYIFDPNDLDASVVGQLVREAAQKPLPHLSIGSVSLVRVEGGVKISVTFSLRSDFASQEEERSIVVTPSSFISNPEMNSPVLPLAALVPVGSPASSMIPFLSLSSEGSIYA